MKKGILYPLPDKFKYSAVFASNIKPIVSAEKDKYLALASSSELKKYLPDIDLEKNYDLLAFAGNLFVANRINANFDGVTTKEALEIADSFIYKFIDKEHSRANLLGCILNSSFTEFGTDKPLKREDLKDYTAPFNVVIGGVIWRIVDEDLANFIEETNASDSDSKEKSALSWELGFSEVNLVLLPPGKKNIEDGKIISDASEISKLESKMKCYGGSGVTDDGFTIGRLPKNEILALGAGVTLNPAGEVGPIVVAEDKDKEDKDSKASIEEIGAQIKEEVLNVLKNEILGRKNDNLISHSQNSPVNDKDNQNLNKNSMIKNIKDITDENLKECKASDIQTVIENRINEINTDWVNKEKEKDKAKADLEAKAKELETSNTKLNEEVAKLKGDLEKLVKASEDKEKQEKFSARMEAFDTEFELSKEEREIIAAEIKDLSDELYQKCADKLNILLAGKKKGKKVTKPEEDTEDEDGESEDKNKSLKTSKASTDTTVVDEAIDKGTKDKTSVAATTSVEESELDKAKKAFGPAGWEPSFKKRRK